jgi:hypothetical protein
MTSTTSAAVSVVVNKRNTTDLTESQVKNIFMGKLGQYSDGTEAIPVLFEVEEGARSEFDDTVLKSERHKLMHVGRSLYLLGEEPIFYKLRILVLY